MIDMYLPFLIIVMQSGHIANEINFPKLDFAKVVLTHTFVRCRMKASLQISLK